MGPHTGDDDAFSDSRACLNLRQLSGKCSIRSWETRETVMNDELKSRESLIFPGLSSRTLQKVRSRWPSFCSPDFETLAKGLRTKGNVEGYLFLTWGHACPLVPTGSGPRKEEKFAFSFPTFLFCALTGYPTWTKASFLNMIPSHGVEKTKGFN